MHGTADPLRDPTHDVVSAAHEARAVRGALDVLTPHQREALELAYLDGYTYRQVAEMLDLPLATVKSRMRSGLARLRLLLDLDLARAGEDDQGVTAARPPADHSADRT